MSNLFNNKEIFKTVFFSLILEDVRLMQIHTNQIDIEKYRRIFEEIYARHSSEWVSRHNKSTAFSFKPSFDLGEYSGVGDKIGDEVITQEIFLEYAAEITKNTPIFPFTITRAVVITDAVIGYCPHLIPDDNAITALQVFSDKFLNGRIGKYLYHERGKFSPTASLHWVRTKEEVIPIVDDINNLLVEIKGQVDSIVISDIGKIRTMEIIQIFKLMRSK